MSRAYCRCVTVRNYSYDEAAQKLRCKRRFLEDRIARLPHQKLGESVAFCDCELALIQGLFTVNAPNVAPQKVPSPTPALTQIRPVTGRRRVGA
ncbi:hypothetical protein OIE91_11560 [Streptomyces albidoflavus]|uniref:hypothetical protein n=1 Tax=Streptomyces TaxID=1883 RepID=UPI002A82FBBC|nr:hypothetical protein [Streptomyces sp. S399]WPR52774.1 hypothetical protein SJI45_18735 [Streptomyces sp. S399]